VPLAETLEAFDQLYRDGKIFSFGVSNFDWADLEECWNLPHGDAVVTNQILYNLTRRNPEHAVLPWCRDHKVAIMAYSPVEQGRLLANKKLVQLAAKRGVTPAQLALAWLLAQPDTIAIPKSGDPRHVEENRAAADITLTAEDLWELDQAFPRPPERKPLETL
jgi:diketogulonate reductase-like aldo/keto reductase